MIRIDHREGISGNFAPLNLSTTSGYVLTFDANGLPVIGPAATAGSVATDILFDAKGDLAVGTGSDTAARLAVGANNFVLTADSTTATGLKWAAAASGGIAAGDSPTWTAPHIFSVNGAADTPAIKLTGTPFLGTATTSKPLMLLEPTGTTSTGWGTAGTMLGANAAGAFTGNLIDVQLAGVSKFKVSSTGAPTFAAGLTTTSGGGNFAGAVTTNSNIGLGASSLLYWGAADVMLSRLGAANLYLGGAASASPIAQKFTIGEASRPGTDSDVAGANGTIQSGLGTGTGTASSLIFQTPTVAGAGSGVQTYGTRLTINANGLNFPTAIATGWIQGTTIYVGVTGTTALKSTVDGILGLYNSAENNFSRLQLGGTTASFPAIKRNGTRIDFRLADDSGDCDIAARSIAASANVEGQSLSMAFGGQLYATAAGVVRISNLAGTDFSRLMFGGTTASFPAIKRSGAALEARLADDSASTDLTVATEAYGAGWNDDMTVPTKDAVYEKINTMAGGSEAKGYLTSNQPTTSSTAVNATGLSFAIAASEVWSFEFNLVLAVSAAGASHKFALDVPTGCTVGAQVRGSSGTTVISADATLGAGVMSTSTGGVIIAGTVQNGANAGTVQLMFASGDGTNTATITGSGSFFMARKMN